MTRYVERLITQGHLSESEAKPVRDGLYEFRLRIGNREVRVFYYVAGRGEYVLLHAIVKKSNRLPKQDVDLALDRMKEDSDKRMAGRPKVGRYQFSARCSNKAA